MRTALEVYVSSMPVTQLTKQVLDPQSKDTKEAFLLKWT